MLTNIKILVWLQDFYPSDILPFNFSFVTENWSHGSEV